MNIPEYGDSLFAGLVRFERMHVYFIGYANYLLEVLVECVPKSKCLQVNNTVLECQQFRDPRSGRGFPRLQHLLKLTHLTAERRVMAVFYWAHVLGTRADVVYEPCRVHAQSAVAALQLIIISTRGRRAYTSRELDIIFKEVGTQFFRQLEQLTKYIHDKRFNRQQADHERNPERHAAPVVWHREAR